MKAELHRLLVEIERERANHDAVMAGFQEQLRSLVLGKKQLPRQTAWEVPGPDGKSRIVRAK